MKLMLTLCVPLVAFGIYVSSKSGCGSCTALRSSAPRTPSCCVEPSVHEFIFALADDKAEVADCPMFGGTPQRNMVNTVAKGIPSDWSVEEGKEKNIKWTAELGDKAYGGPVITGGKIYVGTNNHTPRDPKVTGHKAILMAFNEADGKFLWQIVHDIPADPRFKDAETEGLCSTPVVEGDGIFYVTPGAEVIRANPQGKIVWKYDMMKELGVLPFHLSNCSPLIAGDNLMVITGNGSDGNGKVDAPKAPSFIAIHKDTGKLVWQDASPGEKIIEGQWANPALAVVGGKQQVIFPGGDGVLYSFEPETGKLVWKFNCHFDPPKENEPRNYFVASPVVVGDRMYIGMGVGPELASSPKSSYLMCLDLTKTGDVSPKSWKASDPANKDSSLVWSFGGAIEPRPKTGRPVLYRTTISTNAVHDGLVYASEEAGYLHCFDAKTGERYWFDDLKSGVWGSPYYVDGKVMIGAEDGSVFVYRHGKKKDVIAVIDHGETIHSTPIVANGTLYVTTKSKLFAIAEKK
jgi:outer membrane protein assembly factor BamB